MKLRSWPTGNACSGSMRRMLAKLIACLLRTAGTDISALCIKISQCL